MSALESLTAEPPEINQFVMLLFYYCLQITCMPIPKTEHLENFMQHPTEKKK